jgi:rRNA maturation endonuclease Nob1
LALRAEILAYLERTELDTRFCDRCLLPFPEDKFESYEFCPWCCLPLTAREPDYDESRRIIENEYERQTDIQCGNCGSEYEQPARYRFRFCAYCGSPFAAEDELVIVLPFWV